MNWRLLCFHFCCLMQGQTTVCILQLESPPRLHRLTQCLTHVFSRPVWRDWLVKLGTNVAEGLCPLKRNILWSARGWMSLQIEMHLGVSTGGNNVQQWYLWSLLELPSTGTMSSVVIINPFLFPQHKSFHGSFIPCARTGFQKQFQLKNKVLFFNFGAICIRVSVVYLAGILVFTYLFKGKKKKRKKKRPSMIYGPLQERNFLCRTPNLRGYGERSHWPYKYHGPSTENGWIFILLKKKRKKMSVRSDLWYAEQTALDNTFVSWALLLGQCNGKRKKNILCLYFGLW